MIGRWSWRIGLMLLAVVAVLAQLDRASALRPELSLIVPQPFRSFAQSPIALIAMTGGDAAEAQEEARRLVRRRPLPAEHLFVLAMADLRAGRARAYAEDFRTASTRGWRFGPLQVAAAQAALVSGDVRAAANRVAALWAAEGDNPSRDPLTAALLAAPGGPEAFAVPLAQTHVWSDKFLSAAPALAPAPVILRTVQAAQAAGARFDCDAVRGVYRRLATRGLAAEPDLSRCMR